MLALRRRRQFLRSRFPRRFAFLHSAHVWTLSLSQRRIRWHLHRFRVHRGWRVLDLLFWHRRTIRTTTLRYLACCTISYGGVAGERRETSRGLQVARMRRWIACAFVSTWSSTKRHMLFQRCLSSTGRLRKTCPGDSRRASSTSRSLAAPQLGSTSVLSLDA